MNSWITTVTSQPGGYVVLALLWSSSSFFLWNCEVVADSHFGSVSLHFVLQSQMININFIWETFQVKVSVPALSCPGLFSAFLFCSLYISFVLLPSLFFLNLLNPDFSFTVGEIAFLLWICLFQCFIVALTLLCYVCGKVQHVLCIILNTRPPARPGQFDISEKGVILFRF